LAFLKQARIAERQAGDRAHQGQRRKVRVREWPVLIPAEYQHADRLAAVDERDDGHMLHIGDRLPKLGGRPVAGEPAAEGWLHRLDRFLDERLAGEVIEGIALATPGHPSVSVGW